MAINVNPNWNYDPALPNASRRCMAEKIQEIISVVNTLTPDGIRILDSYDTMEALTAEHPTGALGDAYLVGGDLAIWNGTAWEDVGGIRGKDGTDGKNGVDGLNGTDGITPHIGANGNWFIGEEDTGVAAGASGRDGTTPHIGDNGHWFIGDTDTGVNATGIRGEDGINGTSATHSWDGTVLTVTSASGTSSADLQGPRGERGEPGVPGPQGEPGTPGAKGDTYTLTDDDMMVIANSIPVPSFVLDASTATLTITSPVG